MLSPWQKKKCGFEVTHRPTGDLWFPPPNASPELPKDHRTWFSTAHLQPHPLSPLSSQRLLEIRLSTADWFTLPHSQPLTDHCRRCHFPTLWLWGLLYPLHIIKFDSRGTKESFIGFLCVV